MNVTTDGTPLRSVELADAVEDFERLASLVEETGERVRVTAGGELVGVVLPAAELAELEHWAQRGYGAPLPVPDASLEGIPGPEQQGPYTRYVHADGLRMTLTRDQVIVAEMRSARDLAWLEERARHGRQGYMDPKQSAAFAEFLASQPPSALPKDQPPAPEPHPEEIAVRQVTDAWQRIETWLRAHAPASYASLKPGASQEEIAALEETLGVPVPAPLKALWSLHAGVRHVYGAGFLLDDRALMDLDRVVYLYRMKMDIQERSEALSAIRRAAGRDEEKTTAWKTTWIPVCSFGADDTFSGLYLETDTGYMYPWSREDHYRDDEKRETLVTYLEEIADSLEAPSLSTHGKPGIAGGALVWGPPNVPDPDRPWMEYTG
ncbi:SMI1/KNR4 family protein [Streptomyces sp. NBC_00648]|uniref:SMI1/KNR4 family protein n=1 Tax=Streptomyces sp. NBC_00648 TaxID=2975797 RepID=UPI003245EA7E